MFRLDRTPDGGDVGGAASGGDHDGRPRALRRDRKLRGRNERDGRRLLAQIAVLGVGDGADDLISAFWIIRLRQDMDELAEGLGPAQKTANEGLIDDEHEGRVVGVAVVEAAASKEGNAHGGKVGGAGVGKFARSLDSVHTNFVAPAGSTQGDVGGDGRILDAGHAAHVLNQAALELRFIFRCDVGQRVVEVPNEDAGFSHTGMRVMRLR